MRPHLAFVLLNLGLLGSPAVLAQTIRWDPPGGPLAVGQTTPLQLVCEDCEPKDTPVPPKVAGLSLAFAGQANNMSFINGTYSRSITYTFAALLARKQRIEIPSFEIETNKGPIRVAAASFDPGSATVGSTGQPLDSAANSRLEATPSSVWAGEVFDLGYSIQAARSYTPDFGHGVFDWNADPLVAEDWSQPEPFDLRSGGEQQTGFAYRSRAIAPKSGSFRLNPINQLVNLSVGVSGFGFFQQRQYQQFSVTSTTPTIQVRPLPPAPSGFKGAVGQFTLSSKVVPERAAIGDPVTWTLELGGTGNWPDIPGLPTRAVSKDFQVIQPKAKRVSPPGKLFDAKVTEDVVLVPTRAGTYELPAVSFVFFNPKTGQFETSTAPGAMVTVTEAPAAARPNQPMAAGGAAAGERRPPAPPAPPSGLPRDPLPDEGSSPAPLGGILLGVLLLAPFAAAAGFWLSLAWQRALQTDPHRPQREARARLAETLERVRSEAGGPPSPSLCLLLLAWQRDAAVLWGVVHAAPPAAAIADPAWSTLWEEADRTLYGAAVPLPADWAQRAMAALAARSVRRFRSLQLFRLGNLFPFFFALAILASAGAARGDEGPAYRRGDFAAAERAWRDAIAKEPTAWTARHNLSLALAQQNRWDEAAAQAAAAFVQQPANDAVRWQFELACDKAGLVPAPLAEFLSPGISARMARLASPADWQRILIAAACLFAAGLGMLVAAGYGRGRRLRVPARWVLGFALALGLAATVGWQSYGTAGERDSVVIWRSSTLRSIATEADTSQKTSPLPAGSVARVGKTFLGWLRLDFDNGQTGWVRKEEAVWLWK